MSNRRLFTKIAVISALMIICAACRCYAYPGKEYVIDNRYIDMDMVGSTIDTLRRHTGERTDVATSMYDTTVGFASEDDCTGKYNALSQMFFGGTDAYIFSTCPAYELRIYGYELSHNQLKVKYKYSGTSSNTIKAGWLPQTVPPEAMQRHDKADSILKQIAAGAPEDDIEAYRYFNRQLCDRITYHDDGTPGAHTVYSALCGSGAVCDGYSKAFFALCTMTGRRCMKVGTGEHSRNVVFIDGVPKWIDVTWNDQAGYNKVFLADIDQAGMDYIKKPGTYYEFK